MANKNQIKKIAIGASLMAAAGYIAGVLNAPQSGKKTRQDIKENLLNDYQASENRLVSLHSEISELINMATEEYKDKTLNVHESKKYKMTIELAKDVSNKLNTIIQTIKNHGNSPDSDLVMASKEAEKAIKHLKDFLLKK